jgi:putative aldouronate transport system substrate-binding protein
MKTNKRILAALLCFAFMVSMIAGCTQKDSTPSAAATTAAVTTEAAATTAAASTEPKNPYADHMDISMSLWGIQDGFDAANAANDQIYKNLEAKFNITIKPVQITWNDWTDKLKVWAASDQLPDVFANNLVTDDPSLYSAWATQGIIKALPDGLAKYPNLEKIMTMPSVTPLKINGKFYMVPRMTYNEAADWRMDRVMLYRKDWAAEAGYTNQPKSFDEFLQMAKAVLKLHPKATGLATNTKGFLSTLFLSSFPEAAVAGSWVNENGKWIPNVMSPKIEQGVKEFRTLYKEGVLDQDFAIQKDADGTQKFYSGQAFALFINRIDENKISDIFAAGNPGVNPIGAIDYMTMWPAADGKNYTFTQTPYWSETFFNPKLDDQKFDRILALMDYMNTEEYILLAKNGIEGVDYKIEGGKAASILTGDESLSKKYPITNAICILGNWCNGISYTGKAITPADPVKAAYFKLSLDTFNKLKETAQPAPINFDVLLLNSESKSKAASIYATFWDDLTMVVLGSDDPVTMWKGVIKGYNDKGLQEAVDQFNKDIEAKGIK